MEKPRRDSEYSALALSVSWIAMDVLKKRLSRLSTRRLRLDEFKDALDPAPHNIKTVIELACNNGYDLMLLLKRCDYVPG